MKYTRSESGEVVEVKGCAKCPYVATEQEGGFTVMVCTHKLPSGRKSHRVLKGSWTGNYHASCPLPSDPKMVPENHKVEKPF